jgi:hypothetical protein
VVRSSERVGFDPKARAIVGAQGAPLDVFLSQEEISPTPSHFGQGFRMAHLDGPKSSHDY